MTEYNEGDLVEVAKGEFLIRQRFEADNSGQLNLPNLRNSRPEWLISSGYTITVIEKAKPKVVLPTEPGTVIRFDGVFGVHQLFKNGKWLNTVGGGKDAETPEVLSAHRTQAFDILEPRNITAKAVLEFMDDNRHLSEAALAQKTARHFGVTS